MTKKYKEGTTFNEIVALYGFDSNLRELFFKYLLQIERHMRSLMSYYFSEKYGESQTAYLDENNYNNIPLWVLSNVLTFGNLSKMYKVFPQSLQSKVCKNFGCINRKQMEQFLSVLTKFRNVCAHGERLFTYRTIDNISDLPLHQKMQIPKQGIQYLYGKNDLFAVVIAFRYLLPKEDFLEFKRKLTLEISRANKNLVHITEKELLEHMGFPQNWRNITRYQLTP